jgi:hypothetical protein
MSTNHRASKPPVSADDSPKGSEPAPAAKGLTATPYIEFEERAVIRNGETTVMRILTQMFIGPNGAIEWRDVPCRRLRRPPAKG